MENKEEEVFDMTDGEILEELKFFVYFLFELEEKSLNGTLKLGRPAKVE